MYLNKQTLLPDEVLLGRVRHLCCQWYPTELRKIRFKNSKHNDNINGFIWSRIYIFVLHYRSKVSFKLHALLTVVQHITTSPGLFWLLFLNSLHMSLQLCWHFGYEILKLIPSMTISLQWLSSTLHQYLS